jgi:hypothetical protein
MKLTYTQKELLLALIEVEKDKLDMHELLEFGEDLDKITEKIKLVEIEEE